MVFLEFFSGEQKEMNWNVLLGELRKYAQPGSFAQVGRIPTCLRDLASAIWLPSLNSRKNL